MKLLNQFLLLLCISMSLSLLSSCNNDIPVTTVDDKNDSKAIIVKTINDLYGSKLELSEDLVRTQLAKNLSNEAILATSISKSEGNRVTEGALNLIEELRNNDPTLVSTKEEYIDQLIQILDNNKQKITKAEFEQINASIFISSHILDLYLQEKAMTKGWWDSWGRCAAGITGGAIGGGLGGGAAGSVIPVLGTTAGAIIGAIGGGLTGAAAAC